MPQETEKKSSSCPELALGASCQGRTAVGAAWFFWPIAFFFLLACKLRERQGLKPIDSKNARQPGENLASSPASPQEDAAGPIPIPYEQTSTDNPAEASGRCNPQTNIIAWQTLPNITENLEPYYKFYGDSASSMMVLALPKYQHGNLLDIYLVRASGKLLAQKGLTESADINTDTTLRPILFENLQLKSDRKLIIIYKTSCRDCSGGFAYFKYEMPFSISFSDTFLGKKVFSLSPTSLPGNYSEHQAIATMTPNLKLAKGFYELGYYTVASEEAYFLGSPLLKGFVITDLLGNILAQEGETFNNILQFSEFICYRLVDKQFYIRTLIRVT